MGDAKRIILVGYCTRQGEHGTRAEHLYNASPLFGGAAAYARAQVHHGRAALWYVLSSWDGLLPPAGYIKPVPGPPVEEQSHREQAVWAAQVARSLLQKHPGEALALELHSWEPLPTLLRAWLPPCWHLEMPARSILVVRQRWYIAQLREHPPAPEDSPPPSRSRRAQR